MHGGPKTLGGRLKQARLRMGLPQMQLAAKARLGLGVDKTPLPYFFDHAY